MQSLRSVSSSDDTAIVEIYQRHVYTLLSYIRRYAPTREDAEDILLEVFIAAFEHTTLADLSEGRQLAWLRRVAHNKCVDAYRASQRRPFLSLETATELPTLRAREPTIRRGRTPFGRFLGISAEPSCKIQAISPLRGRDYAIPVTSNEEWINPLSFLKREVLSSSEKESGGICILLWRSNSRVQRLWGWFTLYHQ